MTPVLTKTFTAPLVLERSSSSRPDALGTHESTMQLFERSTPGCMMIEWNMPTLDMVEHIGIWLDDDRNLVDYDGVMELPKQAIELLEEYGVKVGEDFR